MIFDRISCDMSFVKSPFGLLKIFEILFDLLALIIGAAAPDVAGYTGNKGFFIFVSVFGFVITLILFILFSISMRKICCTARWPWIEIIWCALIALLFFIGSIVIAVVGKENGVYGAAAFFGFAAFLTYIADIFVIWRNKNGADPAETYGPSRPGDVPSQPTYG